MEYIIVKTQMNIKNKNKGRLFQYDSHETSLFHYVSRLWYLEPDFHVKINKAIIGE